MNVGVGIVLEFGKNLLGCRHFAHGVGYRVFFILAMEELIQVVHMRNGVEVVFLRRAGGHPLQTAGIPRVKWRAHFAACCNHDVDQEEQHTQGEYE